jgi:hypothetical protein
MTHQFASYIVEAKKDRYEDELMEEK